MTTQTQILLEIGLRAHASGDLETAKSFYEKVLSLDSNSVHANGWLGTIEAQRKNFAKSRVLLERALAGGVDPSFLLNYANVLQETFEYEQALISYMKIPSRERDQVLLSNMAACHNNLGQPEAGLRCADQSLAVDPNNAQAWSNRGIALNDLKRHEEALASYERSIELKPDYAEAWSNRGNALNILKRHEEAIASYERSIELKPDADVVLGNMVHAQMKVCDWADLDSRCHILESRMLAGDLASNPFPILGLFDDPPLQQRCAEIYSRETLSLTNQPHTFTRRTKSAKVHIGYFSADFHNHATMCLMAELFELHDKERFEIFGFSFGPVNDDAMRHRVERGIGKFFDVSNLSDSEVVALSREHLIDIAVDLKGYTQDSRPLIFAHRAAPIQISYLGFPGTMGTPLMDYLIADPVVIPIDSQSAYSEKIIYLPNSYQVNDSKRLISDRVFTRLEVDLPGSGFVFCCFNNNWKITPETLDAWVRIIQSVPNSILWLYEDNPAARRNLSVEASKRGLHADRLVFARPMPHAEHLARYQLADLFLDTFPYGAHTTASDALWAGLPVLTRAGESFASRVASSLLHSTGVPELITYSVEEYESLAVELANNPERLAGLKLRLTANRDSCPLFNTPLFTRHMESAYRSAFDRYHDGLAPDHIYVTA